MDRTAQRVSALVGEFGIVEIRLLETAAILLVLMLLRSIAGLIIARNVQDARTRYHWSKGISYATAFLGLFIIGRVWFVGFRSIATFLGIVAAGLVISLKEPVANVAGWLFLLWRRPFVLGDRIQIGEHAGDVIDRRLFQFTILEIGNWVGADQSTGRIIHIPNGRLFQEPLANYTRVFPYIWNELNVHVTFESNWREAKRLLHEIAERHRLPADTETEILARGQEFMIFYSTLAPTVYVAGGDRGVQLSLRYLCGARQRRGSEQKIWEDLLDAVGRRTDIDFAYPTQRFFDRNLEQRTLRPHGASEDTP